MEGGANVRMKLGLFLERVCVHFEHGKLDDLLRGQSSAIIAGRFEVKNEIVVDWSNFCSWTRHDRAAGVVSPAIVQIIKRALT